MAADPSSYGLFASARRVWLVARHTLTEALRLRLAGLFTVMGVGLVLMALRLREFSFGAVELKFVADIGMGGIGLLAILLAALATAQVIFDDLENGFAACVLAKVVRRWEYLGGRLVGVMALLMMFVGGLIALLAALVGWRESQLGTAFVPLPVFLQACALVWFKTTLVAAMTLLVCTYASSSLFASCTGLLLAAVAHVRAFIGHGQNGVGWLRIWPDLGAFDVDPILSTGRGLGLQVLFSLGAYWLLFLVLFTALAAYVFKQREL